MFKAVIFDMDGVLFDTEALCVNSWNITGVKMGIGEAGYMVYKTMGMTAQRAIEILQQEFGENFDAKEFKERAKAESYSYFEKYGVPQKSGLYATLDYLKQSGYILALASSTSRDSVYHHLNDAGITDYFDCVICGDMVQNSKPAPDIYLKASEKLGIETEYCIAVEDSKNGILSAHNANMQVIMIPDLWAGDKKTDALLYSKIKNLEMLKLIL